MTSTSTWPAWPASATTAVPIRTLAPGHGRLMDHVPDVVDALIAHRLGRHERIAAALARRGAATVDELLPEVYGDVTEQPAARWPASRCGPTCGRSGRGGQGGPRRGPAGEDTIESRWAAAE